ncbi:MAG: NADH-quinone oxidoreductase subunit H [Candidatus Rifleibacteriota bacterium]
MINCAAFIAILLLAPVFPGLINRVKAYVAGKNGPPVFQLYYDLYRLLHKNSVYSKSTSWITRYAPHAIFSATVLAGIFIPFFGLSPLLGVQADIIIFAYLLGFARFVIVIAALDTGSSFEGMGSSREVFYGALAEPSFFCGLLVLVMTTGKISLGDIFAGIKPDMWLTAPAVLGLVFFAWLIILLAENARIPFDDPNTHLELTMIHEVMILDSSGKDLAMLEYSAALKLTFFSAFLANLFCPPGAFSQPLAAILFITVMVLVAFLVGFIEAAFARLKLLQIPKILVGSGALGLIALIIHLSGK